MIKRDDNRANLVDPKNAPIADGARDYRTVSRKIATSSIERTIQENPINAARWSVTADQVCGQLRSRFEFIRSEPLPDRLAVLTEQLQAALDRGDLIAGKRK